MIVLKGAALTELIYPDIGMREMSDIDLLVKEEDMARVSKQLSELGYALPGKTSRPTYFKKDGVPVPVQFHTRLDYLENLGCWDDPMAIRIDGEEAYTLSLEESLIYLSYHLAVSHANTEKKWMEDIRLFVLRFNDRINWPRLARLISKRNLTAPCYHIFLRLQEESRTPFPDGFLKTIKPHNAVLSCIFRGIAREARPMQLLVNILPILLFPRSIFSHLFPPLSFMKLRYNADPPKAYIYYVMRPVSFLLRLTGL